MTASPGCAKPPLPADRRALTLGLLAAWTGAGRAHAAEAEFVMLERRDCPWCRRWHREVGEASWNASDLGRRAPLRRVDLASAMPEDLGFLAAWRFTPTFVLVHGGREAGRIIGYTGDLFFWQRAEALLATLPAREREESHP